MLVNNVDDIVGDIRSGVKTVTLRAEIFSELHAYELSVAKERMQKALAAKNNFPRRGLANDTTNRKMRPR
jgi:hypothetical protein